MANNNENKILNVPNLRFPEFSGEWEMATFGDIAKGFDYGMNAAAKSFDGNNKYIRITDIDEVSSQYLYDDVVSPDGELEDRYLVKENDILLARTGASTGKSYLYRNSDGKLYFAGFLIRANIYKHNSYFVFSQLHTLRYKKWISVMSARSGQPGINSQEYASFPVYTTSLQEEDKIATFLKLLDERIITQNKIIDKLKSLIKGLPHKMAEIGLQKGCWEKVLLSTVLVERKELNSELYTVHSVSVSEGVINQIEYLGRSFAAKDTSNYHVARYGDIIYTKSPTGDFPYGIVKQSYIEQPVAISPLYGVYSPTSFETGVYLHYYFMSSVLAKNYLYPLIQKGAKNTINISNQRFLENRIALPLKQTDRHNIARALITIQKKLDIEKCAMDSLTKQRSYLLQQLFI